MSLILYTNFYTVQRCRDEPDAYFIFGDNTERSGKGGQAVIRDEQNAIGVCTKWRPSRDDAAYFSDKTIISNLRVILGDLLNVELLLMQNKTVYFPSTGIGNGLAEMDIRAPRTYKLMMQRVGELMQKYQFDEREYMSLTGPNTAIPA